MEENQNSDVFEFGLETNPLPEKFQQYREQKNHVDVKIKVGDVVIDAHKLVLEHSSPVIKAMLSEVWSNNNLLEFKEEFMDPEILEELVDYFYKAKITLTLKNARSICVAAHFLQIPALLDACEQFLIKNISLSSVMNFMTLSNNFDLKKLQENCTDYISSNGNDIKNDETFLEMDVEKLKKSLESMKNEKSKLNDEVFDLIINWINHDIKNREGFFPSLFKSVQLQKCSLDFLTDVVVSDPFVNNSLECSRHLNKVLCRILKNYPSTAFESPYLYCLGGENSTCSQMSSMSRFNPITEEWICLAPMKTGRAQFSAITIKKKIYVFGGETAMGITNKCEVYDSERNVWKDIAPMNYARRSSGIAEFDGFIYVFFGYDFNGTFLNVIERYSLQNDRWEQLNIVFSLSQETFEMKKHFLGVNSGIFYFLAKESDTNEDQPFVHLLRFKLSGNVFEQCPTIAKFLDSNLYDDSITIVDNGKIHFLTFENYIQYHIRADVTYNISCNKFMSGGCLICFNDSLLIVGGGSEDTGRFQAFADLYEFNTEIDKWEEYKKMLDIPRMYHCCVVINH